MNLQLSLKKQWFELTRDGIKTEDYRSLTPYWVKRLTRCETDPIIAANELNQGVEYFKAERDIRAFLPAHAFPKKFDKTILTLGYPSKNDTSRIIQFEHLGIEISTGREEWGAEPGKLYFVIKHGKRL